MTFFIEWDEVDLGSGPAAEEVAQVGSDDYREKTRVEIAQYIAQLTRMFPIPAHLQNAGVRFKMKANDHEFGTYHTAIVRYPAENEEAIAFAYFIENSTPEKWDASAASQVLLPAEFERRKLSDDFEIVEQVPETWWQTEYAKTQTKAS